MFLLFGCNQKKDLREEISSLLPSISSPISYEDMKVNAHLFAFDSLRVDLAFQTGIFNPNNKDCEKSIEVKEPIDLKWFSPLKDLNTESKSEAIKNITKSLFQIFGDPMFPEDEGYDMEGLSTEQIIDSVIFGNWSPQCGGISLIASIIINNYTSALQCDVLEIDYPIHTLNVISFFEEGNKYIVLVDFQNGFAFPYDNINQKFYDLERLIANWQIDKEINTGFWWLDTETSKKKRNFVREILPCNFLEDSSAQYHISSKKNYRYERLSYSFHKHYWFDLKNIDFFKFREELYVKLVEAKKVFN